MPSSPSLGRVFKSMLCLVLLIAGARTCIAHPMGNFSINHYAGIQV